jgi:hypothetical protein
MNSIYQINLLKGFSDLLFGQTITEAEKIFGKSEETQELEDDILETSCTVLHYWDSGFSLFFDNKHGKKFSSVEVDNDETVLFSQHVFTLKEKELVELMKANGYVLSDSEQQEWGERRLSFDDAGLDCYFENGRLSSINFGLIEEHNTFGFLPN